jgi:hypothetical protein
MHIDYAKIRPDGVAAGDREEVRHGREGRD